MLWIGIAAFVAGAAADWYMTKRGLEKGGMREVMPVAKYFYRNWDELGLAAVKLLVLGGVILAWEGDPGWPLIAMGAFQFLSGAWNYRVIRRAR